MIERVISWRCPAGVFGNPNMLQRRLFGGPTRVVGSLTAWRMWKEGRLSKDGSLYMLRKDTGIVDDLLKN